MLIDLTDILKNEDKVIRRETEPGFDSFESRLGRFPITCKCPIAVEIRNKGNRELQITGKGCVETIIPCSRCLDDVDTAIRLEFEKVVDMKLTQEERIAALDEHDYIDGYNLDVDKLVYGEILVNWPMKVLCKEDCKGICSICGTNLNLKTCNCDSTDLDPRMAKIRDIFSKFKEV